MTDTNSARHKLPFLVTGQAQKELTHNEALLRIDALLHPVVEASQALPIASLTLSDAGKCWLIADGAQNDWEGHDGEIACWTGGSWRFLLPTEGMRIWNRGQNSQLHHIGGGWIAAITLADINGGSVVDNEARAVINLLLQHLRSVGLASI
jgi:hypothetical protein